MIQVTHELMMSSSWVHHGHGFDHGLRLHPQLCPPCQVAQPFQLVLLQQGDDLRKTAGDGEILWFFSDGKSTGNLWLRRVNEMVNGW